ncbi:type IV secretion system DNA-binding domain-containing protein [Mucilaginibacter sp. X4EP1]|uniref:type IV secretion system DNA-binding domain-containing protein n=1 Tax=Mucilaginibacter sp. X4EP1 TaxID=2723092 RepID=UPI0021673AAB|nr:type IV secretion system DNA-binding domain-containing protein [Mucilaginibacter sp. X4EP1]MCS3814145.1 hypothetical protein [Mucilaginibacter sp. X4EP1]
MISSSQALTNQFYEWEQLGRGWHKAQHLVDLEPAFTPFFGHFLTQPIIDDGKREHWLRSFLAGWKSKDTEVAVVSDHPPLSFPNTDNTDLCIYTITIPKDFKQSTERLEQLLIMLSYRKSHLSFEIIASSDQISLQWVCRDYDATFVRIQIEAFFPDCVVLEAEEDKVVALYDNDLPLYTVDFGLAEEFMRPIAPFQSSDPDGYTPLFGILSRLDGEQSVIMQILFSGTHNAWAESIMTAVTNEGGKQSFFFDAPEMPLLAKEKTARPLFGVTVRAMTFADTVSDAGILLQQVATAIIHASKSPHNSLIPLSDAAYTIDERISDIIQRTTHRVGMLLNSKELATLVHFPATHSAKLQTTTRATKKAPEYLIDESYIFGINEHRGVQHSVGISGEQRLRHLHIMGATGTGKSTLLKALIMQDIYDGAGLMCLDPHGDLVEDILANIPEERIQDVVLIDPHDADFPIAFNILVAHSDTERELVASDLVAVFRRFSTSWGDAMNSVFANAILAFMYNTKQYHLGDLRRFLIEASYRAHILATVTDPDIVYYWQVEYPILKSNSIGSILTRLDAFLRPRVIRNMLCQNKSIDFGQLMDSNKIVLVKLSQGLLGMENSYLLGAFIVSKLQQTAMARQMQEAKDRVPFFCYIDEFQHFITPSMASILSGARKYGLGLVLSHQDIQQVAKYDPEIASSVLANAGTRMCFRLGDTDAKRLEDGFAFFTAKDFQNLPIGEAIVRVNTADNDFNLTVIPYNLDTTVNYVEKIIEFSRVHYSVPIQPQPSAPIEPEPGPVPQQPAPKEPIVPLADEEPTTSAKQEHIREHRYLQTFVKAMAEAHGYIAQLEVPTPDGTGQVDVLLEKNGVTIAVEISVTTSPEWELHNIKKCLAAGYNRIVVCTSQSSKLTLIQRQITAHLTPAEQQKVDAVLSNDIHTIFESTQQAKPTETLVKGYRVKVNYEPNANRQDLLQSVIKAAKK